MLNVWFMIAVLVIPFNDFYGLLPLGELRNDLSAYLALPLLLVVLSEQWLEKRFGSGQKIGPSVPSLLSGLTIILLVAILFSGIVNIVSLADFGIRGRSPLGKFLGSTMVVIYGSSWAYLGSHFVGRESWHRMIVKPICISVAICAGFACIEMSAPLSGLSSIMYDTLSKVVHSNVEYFATSPENIADWRTVGRARSVCFEPPALATFAGLAWPWTYAGVVTASKNTKLFYVILFLLNILLLSIAVSRTSVVLLVGNVVVWGLLRYVYLSHRPIARRNQQVVSLVLVTMSAAVIAIGILEINVITSVVIQDSEHVSNITRYSLILSGINMFFSHPVLGVGFGQYGFHFVEFLPSWGYESWEVRDYVAGVNGRWPSVFSTYARFAAETGIVGLTVWVGVWITLIRAVWRATIAYQRATGRLLLLSRPVILSCCSALLSGLTVDSVRMPVMWLSMGIACSYVHDVYRRLNAVLNVN